MELKFFISFLKFIILFTFQSHHHGIEMIVSFVGFSRFVTSNRTIMELKFLDKQALLCALPSSNRTIMELK